EVVIGASNVQKEFSDNLTGVNVGEEKVFKVHYPEDFSSKGLAGKELEYTASVSAIRAKELPELDDEFAKGLGVEIDSIDDLRKRISDDLALSAERHASSVMRDELLDKLVKLNPFEVPSILVQQQVKARIEGLVREMIYRRMQLPDTEVSLDAIRQQASELALSDVRGALILDQIARDEKITISNDEVDEEIHHLAEHNG